VGNRVELDTLGYMSNAITRAGLLSFASCAAIQRLVSEPSTITTILPFLAVTTVRAHALLRLHLAALQNQDGRTAHSYQPLAPISSPAI